MRITDGGSFPQRVRVVLEGVPTVGVVDSGSDITIMGKDLLRHVAAAAKLGRSSLKKVDKVPKTYDGQPFTLHGRVDLNINFEGNTMRTPVYIKFDTPEELLLSEGILNYHPSVIGQTNKHHPRVRTYSNDISRGATATRETPAHEPEGMPQGSGDDPRALETQQDGEMFPGQPRNCKTAAEIQKNRLIPPGLP